MSEASRELKILFNYDSTGISVDNSHRSSEEVLRGIFSAFGLVQTCIVNVEKRHAFVKMLTRSEAMIAKEGMERYKSSEMQLRVKYPKFTLTIPSSAQLGLLMVSLDSVGCRLWTS